jgi:hypothetical protein
VTDAELIQKMRYLFADATADNGPVDNSTISGRFSRPWTSISVLTA